jgi:multidrug efflux pump subunit AcrA (membrane-fusion protein)
MSFWKDFKYLWLGALGVLFLMVGLVVIISVKNSVIAIGTIQSSNEQVVYAEVESQISDVLVKSGEWVEKGAILCLLNSDRIINEASNNLDQIAIAEARLSKLMHDFRIIEINPLPEEFRNLDEQIKLQKLTVQYHQDHMLKFAPLAQQGFVSEKSLALAQIEKSGAETRMSDLLVKNELLSKGLSEQIVLAEKSAIEEEQQKITALKRQQKALETRIAQYTIKAPFAGLVVEVYKKRQEWLEPSHPVCRIVDWNKKQIECWVDQSQVQMIKIGQSAIVQSNEYQSFDQGEFAATVAFIDANIAKKDNGLGCRILLDINDCRWPIHYGSSAEVQIVVDDHINFGLWLLHGKEVF